MTKKQIIQGIATLCDADFRNKNKEVEEISKKAEIEDLVNIPK